MGQLMNLVVEPSEESSGQCDCCGTTTRKVWGSVSYDETTVAVYYVRWTVGHLEHDPRFDLVIGRWGEDATDDDRCIVSLLYRPGGGFMVIDGRDDIASGATHMMARDDVIGTPLAQNAFDLLDAIWLQDSRIAEITQVN